MQCKFCMIEQEMLNEMLWIMQQNHSPKPRRQQKAYLYVVCMAEHGGFHNLYYVYKHNLVKLKQEKE